MKWLELKIDAAPAGLDPVSALLEDLGITGLVIDDEGDFRDFLEHNRAYWDYVDDALLLGADRAVACDIDEKCMDVAYENAALNGVGRDRYTVRWGDVVTDRALRRELGGPYDVVVANIVADVIKALASTVRPLVREGGIFLCSGIIDDRAEEVAQCLRDNGWTIAETRSSEGWFSYLCR